jgi:hypothetical protein
MSGHGDDVNTLVAPSNLQMISGDDPTLHPARAARRQ